MATQLGQLLPDLLFDAQWEERRKMIDDHADDLLSDVADGRLAVIASSYSHDPRFADRVGAVRSALEEGRFDGFDGVKRPLSYYFAPLFSEGGPEAHFVEPTARTPPPGDEYEQMVADVTMAFMQALTWETRRRIATAYSDIVLGGALDEALKGLATEPGYQAPCELLQGVLASARKVGLAAALSQAPASPALFASEFAKMARPQFLKEEGLQLAWLAYLQAPAWHRRREILQANQDVLLDPDLASLLERLWAMASSELPERIVKPARMVLDSARREGVKAAFAEDPGPSHVSINKAVAGSLAAEGSDAQRIDDLRRLSNFVDPGILPRLRATVNSELAAALIGVRAGPLRPEAVEEAVSCCLDALVSLRSDVDSERWRRCLLTLGNANLRRVRGDRTASGEAAIACFDRAARSAADASDAATVASASTELAEAYLHRLAGIRVQNLELALRFAQGALNFYGQAGDRNNFAWTSAILGLVYRERKSGEESANRSAAIEHLTEALSTLDPKSDPDLWGSVQQSLGGIYATAGPEYYRQATQHLEAALTVFTRDQFEVRWAETQTALGAAAFRAKSRDEAAVVNARRHYEAALEVFTQSYPVERRRVLRELAATYFHERRWQEALEPLEEAIALGQWLEASTGSDAARLAEISDLVNVYERAAYCLVQLGRAAEALPLLDSGKTRGIRHVLGVGGKQEDKLSLAELRQVFLEEASVVVPVITSQGSVAFLITHLPGEPPEGRLLDLPNLRDADLRALLDGTPDHQGWLFAYRGWLEAQDQLAHPAHETTAAGEMAAESAQQDWANVLSYTCARIWDHFMGPVHAALADAHVPVGSTVRIMPSKWLNLLPLHAAWHQERHELHSFIDDYAVAYAPSGWMLASSKERLRRIGSTQPRLLAAINPTDDLRFAETEGQVVERAFAGKGVVLPVELATVKNVIADISHVSHMHLACHGEFDWLDPSASGLRLAHGELLSARAVASLPLQGIRLVTLSACETGITDSNFVPDEYVGLAGSFLQAGAAAVVCSLWSVDDESTAQLMATFYRRHVTEAADPASALRDAQLELRRDQKFNHPFFWAPFQVVGA